MKLGITDGACSRYGNETYNKIKALGYDTVDFGMANTETELYKMEEKDFIECLTKEKEIIEKAGLEVFQVHGPWRCPPRDFEDADRLDRLEKMKKSIRGTAALGCKYWVIHPIMPYGVEDLGTENQEKTWQLNKEFFTEILAEAKKYGVTVCFENMPFLKFSISTPEQIMAFVEEMNDDNFKVCLDTGHVNVFKGKTVADAVRIFGDKLCVLHCHDNDGNGDRHSLPYFGTIDWEEFCKALCEIGYDGSFSLECAPPSKLPNELYDAYNEVLFQTAKKLTSSFAKKKK